MEIHPLSELLWIANVVYLHLYWLWANSDSEVESRMVNLIHGPVIYYRLGGSWGARIMSAVSRGTRKMAPEKRQKCVLIPPPQRY